VSDTVPVQTITFSEDPKKPPISTAQLSLALYYGFGPNDNGSGWVMDVHGNANFNLQLDAGSTGDAVEVTLMLWPTGGMRSVYDIVVNDQMLVHRNKIAPEDWKDYSAVIPANQLVAGANSIVLKVSGHDGGAAMGVKSITVQSDFSANTPA
jgi:hypothetical protein